MHLKIKFLSLLFFISFLLLRKNSNFYQIIQQELHNRVSGTGMSDEMSSASTCRSAFTGHSFPVSTSDEILMDAGQLDTHEFDRYLNKSQHDMDSNHNYQHQIQQQQQQAAVAAAQMGYYHHQQAAAHHEAMIKGEPDYGAADIEQHHQVVKTEDEFSLILADVRKTCYNSS